MPPICPHTCLCLCVGLEALHVVGVVMAPPCVMTPSLHGGASPLHPHTQLWGLQGFPMHWYVSGISVCYVGIPFCQ